MPSRHAKTCDTTVWVFPCDYSAVCGPACSQAIWALCSDSHVYRHVVPCQDPVGNEGHESHESNEEGDEGYESHESDEGNEEVRACSCEHGVRRDQRSGCGIWAR